MLAKRHQPPKEFVPPDRCTRIRPVPPVVCLEFVDTRLAALKGQHGLLVAEVHPVKDNRAAHDQIGRRARDIMVGVIDKKV